MKPPVLIRYLGLMFLLEGLGISGATMLMGSGLGQAVNIDIRADATRLKKGAGYPIYLPR